jgi:aspartate/methionine/tyrosine aminotransferase
MKIQPFALERFFARYEFSVRFMLSSSDCESLSMNELLDLASPETRRLWDELRLGYTESPGHPLLRAEIARLYETLDPDHILTAAPEEAILIAMNALLDPGDHMIYLHPAYQSLYQVAEAIGCRVSAWPLQWEAGQWSLDLNLLERLIEPRTRLIVVNFPHNPTGFLPSRAEFDAILEIAARTGIAIFSDEMYRLLETEPADRLPAAVDRYERAVSLSGLSKSFGLAGLRAGWLANSDAGLMAAFQHYKDYTTICGSAPGEILAIIALQAAERILARTRAIVARNRSLAEACFLSRPDMFEWAAPRGGSIAFPLWRGPIPLNILCEGLLSDEGVMVVPGNLFGVSESRFRVGLGRADFPEAIHGLERYLSKIKQAP